MATERGIHVIDGSYLFSSINAVWRLHPELKDKKLHLDRLSQSMQEIWSQYTGPTIRVVYYFMKDDPRIKTLLEIPDQRTPDAKSHWQINECAHPNKAQKLPAKILSEIPEKYHNQLHPSEKGLDMELACDTLLFLTNDKADSVVFFVNDRDYLPLFNALQRLGANTYLTGLDRQQPIQKDLAAVADMYKTLEVDLHRIFNYTPPPPQEIKEN